MKLSNEIKTLFSLFNKSGFKLYLVGGSVRDYLLNKEVYDYDFATSATPSDMVEILKDYNLDTYQKKLGSIKVHIDKKTYEITTFRKEEGVNDFRYPKTVKFVDSLELDVLRRDFTINAIAYSINEGVIDYLNGIDDLKNKQIKFIKDTVVSINEDPIRLIRALRFSLTLGFHICNDDLDAFRLLAYKVNDLGKIKYDELKKIFELDGCKQHLIKYYDIYQKAYGNLFNDQFKQILKTDIDIEYLKYIISFYQFNEYFINTKKDKMILNGLYEVKDYPQDLYHTKLLIIKYQDLLKNILDILACLGYDVNNILDNFYLIKNNNYALSIKDLKLSYLDLEQMDIDKSNYSKILNYLLEEVLKNEELNNKEELIKIVYKIIDDNLK